MEMGELIFWAVVGAVSLSVVWGAYLSRREAERTVRLALERGVALDVAAIRELRFGSPHRMPVLLLVCGALLLSVALGLAALGVIIAPEEPETLLPLLGLAAFAAIPACALIAVGILMQRQRRAEKAAPPA